VFAVVLHVDSGYGVIRATVFRIPLNLINYYSVVTVTTTIPVGFDGRWTGWSQRHNPLATVIFVYLGCSAAHSPQQVGLGLRSWRMVVEWS